MMYIDKGVKPYVRRAFAATAQPARYETGRAGKTPGRIAQCHQRMGNGISFPSLANLFELCHVFGTTPDYLLGFSSEHCVDISALTPSQQEMVVRLIHCFEEQNDMQKGKAATSV